MKVKVTIVTTEVAIMEVGNVPANMVRDLLLKQGDGTFDGNWSPADVARQNVTFTTDSIEVEEVAK